MGTNFIEIWFRIFWFSFKKINLKKWTDVASDQREEYQKHLFISGMYKFMDSRNHYLNQCRILTHYHINIQTKYNSFMTVMEASYQGNT